MTERRSPTPVLDRYLAVALQKMTDPVAPRTAGDRSRLRKSKETAMTEDDGRRPKRARQAMPRKRCVVCRAILDTTGGRSMCDSCADDPANLCSCEVCEKAAGR